MILFLTLLTLATSIIILSFSYQVLIFNRSISYGRGWIRLIIHNMGVSTISALGIALTLAHNGDLNQYWYFPFFVIGARILGDIPLVIIKESRWRDQNKMNHDIVSKFNG